MKHNDSTIAPVTTVSHMNTALSFAVWDSDRPQPPTPPKAPQVRTLVARIPGDTTPILICAQ